jgi:predicted nucleic acid-binding protein
MALSREVAFGGKQLHDANIVATMLAHGETRILTFNAPDFRRFAPMIEVLTP